ncbi:MAG: hypothetical protein N3A66_12110, partial [Planctomycetota bacterium]|nr:hypothetical protein [Planctomycetota bacterium]
YAVVGAVGGYLLSQAAGFGLDALGLKQRLGMTLNYSSLATVAVTAVIMLVVLLSSLSPARMAAKLAAPAEQMERAFVTSEGGIMTLDLPFTFNRRDRIAILPYMADWFENYGEGSAGEFFSSPPEIGITRTAEALTPFVRTITWLKPYDLGVSQEVKIEVRHDPRTGDNLATVIITCRSGDKSNWERCCHLFIGLLRKRFLTWRAVSEDDRRMLWVRGKAALLATAKSESVQG